MEKGQFVPAEKIYLQLLEREDETTVVLTALGNLYQVTRQYDLAAACFGRALELAPGDGYSKKRHDEMVQSYGVGFTSEALETVRCKVKALNPPPPPPAPIPAVDNGGPVGP